MKPIISIQDVSKRYTIGEKASYGSLREEVMDALASPLRRVLKGEARREAPSVWAIKDVSFEVNEGDVVGIVGRNGAGKSTLLKILSRITEPTEGRIKMRGRIASLLEVGTGFHPELTGRENIFLNGALLGMTAKEIKARFDEIVAFSEIEKFLDTPVKRYSSGMYVRLAFAVAAHLEPEILIIDEVLAVGDAIFQKKCLGKMGEVAKGGRTVIFVSHNMVAVQGLCNRAVLMEGGRAIMSGPTRDIVGHYLSNSSGIRRATREYPSNPAKQVKIRKVAVRNQSGEEKEILDLNEKITIQVDYELREPTSNISIGLKITPEESGQCLISLSDPELDLSRLDKREKGYYSSTVEIPPRTLNTGSYQISAGATALRNIYDVVEDVCFTVTDSVGIVQCIGFERKNALLSMQLPWKINYLGTRTVRD